MKSIIKFFLLLSSIALFSCTEEAFIEGTPSKGLTAQIPSYQFDSQTRVNISPNLSTFTWSDGDKIGIYYTSGSTYADAKFTLKQGGSSHGEFYNEAFSLKPNSTYYAFYPYNSEATVDSYPVDFTGQVQTANGSTTHIGARNYMSAEVNTDASGAANISFQNLAAVIQVVIPIEEDGTYTRMTLSSTDNDFITQGSLNMKTGKITSTEKTQSLELSLGEGLSLNKGDVLTANILVAPTDLSGKELTVTLNSIDGESLAVNFTGMSIQAGKAYKLADGNLTEIPYLTFTAEAEQTLTMSQAVETLEYSVNNGEWKELGINTVTFGGANGDLIIRGQNSNGTSGARFCFGNDTEVFCTGDLRTLVDYENYRETDTSQAIFMDLFAYNPQLVSAPMLPAKKLAPICYAGMFEQCTGLKIAPELPATEVPLWGYQMMFYGCEGLIQAPELPATTLSDHCYSEMFSGCTSLITAPELQATTLAEYCCHNMFANCTNLKKASQLPATILSDHCYFGMFANCTSLTTAPELMATNLADGCCEMMFYMCANLTTAPKLLATTLADRCYSMMFYGTGIKEIPAHLQNTELVKNWLNRNVGLQGFFAGLPITDEYLSTVLPVNSSGKYYLPATILTEGCYTNMFRECTSLKTAPELPATTLADYCYSCMFLECTNLTTAPGLPATTLTEGCYGNMFGYCKNLTTAPKLPATTLAEGCYHLMFNWCTSLITAPDLPAAILAERCYADMFWRCTNLTTAPDLPAITLASGCYYCMFEGCSNLNHIKMMATDISATECLYDWTNGVSSSGTFIKNPAATWNVRGTSGVPEGWTIKYDDESGNGNGSGTINPGNNHEG